MKIADFWHFTCCVTTRMTPNQETIVRFTRKTLDLIEVTGDNRGRLDGLLNRLDRIVTSSESRSLNEESYLEAVGQLLDRAKRIKQETMFELCAA